MHQQQNLLLRAWETRSQTERRTSQRSDVVGRAHSSQKVELNLDLKRRRSVRQRVEVRVARTEVTDAREQCATSYSFGVRTIMRWIRASLPHANNVVASCHATSSIKVRPIVF